MTLNVKIFFKSQIPYELVAAGWGDLSDWLHNNDYSDKVTKIEVVPIRSQVQEEADKVIQGCADLEQKARDRALKAAAERAAYEVLRGLAEPMWTTKYLSKIESLLKQISDKIVEQNVPRKKKRRRKADER